MFERKKLLIITLAISLALVITVVKGEDVTREEKLERKAYWMEVVEPKFSPYYIKVWEEDEPIGVASVIKKSDIGGFPSDGKRNAYSSEPELIRDTNVVEVRIHPSPPPGHYVWKVSPDLPQNLLISDDNRAEFRARIPGKYTFAPEYHTIEGEIIRLAQADEQVLENLSLKVRDKCRQHQWIDGCESAEVGKCKRNFGIGEQVDLSLIYDETGVPDMRRHWWTHSNHEAGDFIVNGSRHDEVNAQPLQYQANYEVGTETIEDIITVEFNPQEDPPGSGNVKNQQKDIISYIVVKPNWFIPVAYDDYQCKSDDIDSDPRVCSDIGKYGIEGDKSIGIGAGYYLSLLPSDACFRNLLVRENFTGLGNPLGPNNCFKITWPNGKTGCVKLGDYGDGTIWILNDALGVALFDFDKNIFRDKAYTGLWPKEAMNNGKPIYQLPVKIKIEWAKVGINVWTEMGFSGFCNYFNKQYKAKARRVVDRITESDSETRYQGYKNPCATPAEGMKGYYVEGHWRGPWEREPLEVLE